MSKRNIIINTITHWDEPPRTRHQVAQALAKEHRVVFVTANRIGFPRLCLDKVDENLEVLTPYFPINYKIRYRIPILNHLFQKWLYSKLKKQYGDHVMINFDFTALLIHRYFIHPVYYCNDDHVGLSQKTNPKWIGHYHGKCEEKVIRSASFCVGTSSYLVERMRKLNVNSWEIRLGAPSINELPRSISNDLENKKKSIHVGIVGYVRTIDIRLIEYFISKKDLHLTLVGPVTLREKSSYSKYSNINLTGSLIGKDLYDEVNRFDVGLIPYRMHNTIDRTPNKLWLYLAVGKPVVISNIKGIKDWSFPEHFVYRANNQVEFYNLIKQARLEDTPELTARRISFARENSWDVRMKDFIEILDRIVPPELGLLEMKG